MAKILLSKPVLLVLGLLSLLVIGTFQPTWATIYTRTLPSNTIFFDDFENGIGDWKLQLNGNTAGAIGRINSTLSFNGNASVGMYEPNVSSSIEIMRSIALPVGVTRVGIQAWTAFNYAMYTNNQGNAPEIKLVYWDHPSATQVEQHIGMVEYRPGRGQFMVFTPSSGTPLQYYQFPGSNGLRQGYFAYNDQLRPTTSQMGWYWQKMVIDTSTDTYVSYCASIGCFANVTGAPFTEGVGTATAPAQTVMRIGLSFTEDTVQCNCNALFDNVLVTDETPGGPLCGPLCLSAINLSAWFGVLMVTVGAGTSSSLYFGAARMLRGEPFKSKEVVALLAAGALGVLAFGVMMAVAVGLIKIIPGG